MSAQVKKNSTNEKAANLWYQMAVWTAIVAGLFSLIVLGFLIQNYFMTTVYDAARTEKLEAMKAAIRSNPDEQLISSIRQLDLQLRRSRIRRLDFSRKGGYLFFGGVVVSLLALRWATAIRKKLPAPQLSGDSRDRQAREATYARWAVTVSLVVLTSGAVFLALGRKIDFTKVGAQDAPYVSMEEISKNWPSFRGPFGLGVSAYTNIPANWNGKTGKGILWKSKVPLPGHNSPLVWGDRVFVAGADPNRRQVYCYDASSGELLWQGTVITASQTGTEPLKLSKEPGYAAPTMATNGRQACAIFPNGDVGCFNFAGKRLWGRNLGLPDSAYGYASSLAVYRNKFLVLYDQGMVEDEKSKLIALNAFSGRSVWEAKRPVGSSWTSPIVVKVGHNYQVITCGDPWVIAYDPNDGAEIWRVKCLSGDLAPSPIYAGGLVFAIEPYNKLVAIRPDGRGDVTKTHIAWSIEDGTPDICSPVSNGELIFLLTSDGLLMCYQVTDGTKLWEKDLREDFRASPSLVGNHLYLLNMKGVMRIIEAGPEYKELARCELGEDCYASPAFADGRIYIRGTENLFCIENRN